MNETLGNHDGGVGAEILAKEPSYAEHMRDYETAKLAGKVPEGVRDAQDYEEYLEEKAAREREKPLDLANRAEREKANVPRADLCAKRRVVIARKYPALKPLSLEDRQRAKVDASFRGELEQAVLEVPEEVREEYRLLGVLINRMEEGINASLAPHSELAKSEPNQVPQVIKTGSGDMVVSLWHKKATEEDLKKLAKLHEQNAKTIDFSHERGVDIDTIPGDVRQAVRKVAEKLEKMQGTDFSEMSKEEGLAAIHEAEKEVEAIQGSNNVSYRVRQQISKAKRRLRQGFATLSKGVEAKAVEMRVAELEMEKTAIEEKQEKNKKSFFVVRMFRGMFGKNRKLREKKAAIEAELKRLEEQRGSGETAA